MKCSICYLLYAIEVSLTRLENNRENTKVVHEKLREANNELLTAEDSANKLEQILVELGFFVSLSNLQNLFVSIFSPSLFNSSVSFGFVRGETEFVQISQETTKFGVSDRFQV